MLRALQEEYILTVTMYDELHISLLGQCVHLLASEGYIRSMLSIVSLMVMVYDWYI